ncbi:Uncharacterised protein [Mycobacteroides abscessus subsp. abscessus]|nr:Uncharacterised protein [Mycobacteroides abscessus subsp. abscessus]SKU47009.1 Uncharacterised protein [Mycobacteroides abscessus subsp. abscessus]SLE58478.1 Uncharacterised protein [Mycobacteroides abscessus subsp. massiliense]
MNDQPRLATAAAARSGARHPTGTLRISSAMAGNAM